MMDDRHWIDEQLISGSALLTEGNGRAINLATAFTLLIIYG